jgi:hypothetical protein
MSEDRYDVFATSLGGKRRKIARAVKEHVAVSLVQQTRAGMNAPYVSASMKPAKQKAKTVSA